MAPRTFVHPLQLRWADLDLLGHVNNVRHVEYAQEARIAFLTELDRDGTFPRRPAVVVRQEVDYVRPLELHHAPVEVHVSVAAVGGSSWTVQQVLLGAPAVRGEDGPDGPPVYSRVRSVIVGVDTATGRPVRLTDAERARLGALVPAPDAVVAATGG